MYIRVLVSKQETRNHAVMSQVSIHGPVLRLRSSIQVLLPILSFRVVPGLLGALKQEEKQLVISKQ